MYDVDDLSVLVGHRVVASYRHRPKHGNGNWESLLMSNGMVVGFDEQDPYTYHDASSIAREVSIVDMAGIHENELIRRFGRKAINDVYKSLGKMLGKVKE